MTGPDMACEKSSVENKGAVDQTLVPYSAHRSSTAVFLSNKNLQ